MGLKQDLIDAKVKAAKDAGITKPLDTSNGTFIEREAEYTKEAIVNFLTSCEFRITKLNAPVVLENFKIPPQEADIKNTVTSTDVPYPSGIATLPIRNPLNGGINGVITKDIDVDKLGGNTGFLQSTGYTFIGGDPDSQFGFDVDGEDGQREFTTVKLIREDIGDLL